MSQVLLDLLDLLGLLGTLALLVQLQQFQVLLVQLALLAPLVQLEVQANRANRFDWTYWSYRYNWHCRNRSCWNNKHWSSFSYKFRHFSSGHIQLYCTARHYWISRANWCSRPHWDYRTNGANWTSVYYPWTNGTNRTSGCYNCFCNSASISSKRRLVGRYQHWHIIHLAL